MSAPATTDFETIIGLEVHAQLTTKSKMFCRCSVGYHGAPPNTLVCPVCLGLPGSLPVINEQALEHVAMTGLALHCTIAQRSKFDRKNYPYPDLMKGYQISQYDAPICSQGWLAIEVDGQSKRAGVTRVHLEEDVAKLFHRRDPVSGETYSLVDVNRSGVPLMEIVGEPDLRSPEEARQYLVKLQSILRYLGVSQADMEKGNFRCDANISIRPRGSTTLMSRVEVKNMNSLRSVYRALEFEAERQRRAVQEGERIVQETRGWVEERGETVSQRSKEQAHDYRYFPEPDLPPLAFTPEWIEALRQRLPELPDARRERFMRQYSLPPYDAGLLTASRALADLYERCVAGADSKRYKTAANWLLGELSRLLNATGTDVSEVKITPAGLGELLDLLEAGGINQTSAKEIFEAMFRSGRAPREVMAEKGLAQISGTDELGSLVQQTIAANPKAVADYAAGKDTALGFLTGQVMRATKGRANPTVVQQLLRERLAKESVQ